MKKLYWTENATANLLRSDLDGSNKEILIAGLPNPLWVLPDVVTGKIWFDDSGTLPNTVRNCNYDGTGQQTIINVSSGFDGIALDHANGKLWWVDSHDIHRSNFDGSNIETVSGDHTNPLALAIHGGYVYWGDNIDSKIYKIELTSPFTQTVWRDFGPNNLPIAFAIYGDYLYYTEERPSLPDRLLRRDLADGLNPVVLLNNLTKPVGVAHYNGQLYVADVTDDKIIRVNVDGTDRIDLLTGVDGAFSLNVLDTELVQDPTGKVIEVSSQDPTGKVIEVPS